MRKARIVIVLLVFVALAPACSGGGTGGSTSSPAGSPTGGGPSPVTTSPGSTPSAGSVTGAWKGTWESTKYPPANGTFDVVFAQTGQALSGTVRVNESTCIPVGTLTGVLAGSAINFGAVEGAHTVTYTGSVQGDSMSGTYKAPQCADDAGTWTATRV